MTGLTQGRSNAELTALARAFAAMRPPVPATEAHDVAQCARGEMPAAAHRCGACHLPDHAGAEHVPRLAGQREGCLLVTLRTCRAGEHIGIEAAMAEVLSDLDDDELDDLACRLGHLDGRPQAGRVRPSRRGRPRRGVEKAPPFHRVHRRLRHGAAALRHKGVDDPDPRRRPGAAFPHCREETECPYACTPAFWGPAPSSSPSPHRATAQPVDADAIRAATAAIDGDAIVANAENTRNWLSYGLDYAETRHSKLAQINIGNVDRLGLAWSAPLDSKRGVEATPIVVDGVMYVTASWSVVHALDARTGEHLWVYDPKVPKEYAYKGCCDVVNRGVAVWKGTVFVGAYDGLLRAIDAATGERRWVVDTVENREMSYTVTGAPRVYNGKVLIGNGGAEYGVRGYLTAYDAESGEQVWRWYSVPGNPADGFEDPSMEMAAATWDPAVKWWEAGGGGTMWDAMAFDPKLNLMYVGTGNASPWNHALRSPAGGDNLFVASVVALDPDTGAYKWHYQHTPGDNWDYTSTQHIILADLPIEGETRKVLMQAPKNGFFYVIDRETGEFLSAEPFVKTTWATHYDENGRPVENPAARSTDTAWEQVSSAYGAHNWHPMSFNPGTGLVYIPAQGVPLVVEHDPEWKLNAHIPGRPHSNLGWNLGFLLSAVPPTERPFGQLLAWDPVAQREVWRQEHASPWNGGTLTTAGIRRATDSEEMWLRISSPSQMAKAVPCLRCVAA